MTLLYDLDNEAEWPAETARRPPAVGPVLAVDIGAVHTRAVLLDLVEGSYRFVAWGESATTGQAPWHDVLVGVYQAAEQIEGATGRRIFDESGDLIMPEAAPFVGVGTFAATASGGEPIRAVLVGLMPGFSLESGRRAAESTYVTLVDTLGLAGEYRPEDWIDRLLAADADLVILVGGTNGGATDVVRRHLETITLATSLMPREDRPPLLYAGNEELSFAVRAMGEEVGLNVLTASNVRPSLHVEVLDGALATLASVFTQEKLRTTTGIADMVQWTEYGVQPTAHGYGRMIRLLGGLWGHDVLGVDVGSSATTVAVTLGGKSYLHAFGGLGVGHAAVEAGERLDLADIARWLAEAPADEEMIADYLHNRAIFPATIPADRGELDLLYALTREIVRLATLDARQGWRGVPPLGLLPHFGTILLSGATLTRSPHYGWSALLALDALLPTGVTRLVLDPYGMAAALGTIAPLNPPAVVQSMDIGAFRDLGTVISLSGQVRPGGGALRGAIRREGDEPERFEVAHGSLAVLPLNYGQRATLTLDSPGAVDGLGRDGTLDVVGGELGIVVDARGRPWRFARTPEARREQMRGWQQAMVGRYAP
jgi:hypothetical protein